MLAKVYDLAPLSTHRMSHFGDMSSNRRRSLATLRKNHVSGRGLHSVITFRDASVRQMSIAGAISICQ